MKIRIGTRGSKLALIQASQVESAISQIIPTAQVEIIKIKTLGDKKQGTPNAKVADKKEWIYELEEALIAEQIDVAIHSGKDVPIDISQHTTLKPVLKREEARDAFVGALEDNGKRLAFSDLPHDGVIGTSSLRRKAQLKLHHSGVKVIDHRGNVPTRIRKLDESGGSINGIILAGASLVRLGFNMLDCELLDPTFMVPALNQGILVAQYRIGDRRIEDALSNLCDTDTCVVWLAERSCATTLQGDCRSAIGIFARMVSNHRIAITCRVLTPDGSECLEESIEGEKNCAKELGITVAKRLLSMGADKILHG